jgi:DNA-binding NarL/FixJ family response regulator
MKADTSDEHKLPLHPGSPHCLADLVRDARHKGNGYIKETVAEYIERGGHIATIKPSCFQYKPRQSRNVCLEKFHYKFPSPEAVAIANERRRLRGERRRAEIFNLMDRGYTHQQIAMEFNISIPTVRKYIYRKKIKEGD